jgi:hypothetical protein
MGSANLAAVRANVADTNYLHILEGRTPTRSP